VRPFCCCGPFVAQKWPIRGPRLRSSERVLTFGRVAHDDLRAFEPKVSVLDDLRATLDVSSRWPLSNCAREIAWPNRGPPVARILGHGPLTAQFATFGPTHAGLGHVWPLDIGGARERLSFTAQHPRVQLLKSRRHFLRWRRPRRVRAYFTEKNRVHRISHHRGAFTAHQVRRAHHPRTPQGQRPARGRSLHPTLRRPQDPLRLGGHRAQYRQGLTDSANGECTSPRGRAPWVACDFILAEVPCSWTIALRASATATTRLFPTHRPTGRSSNGTWSGSNAKSSTAEVLRRQPVSRSRRTRRGPSSTRQRRHRALPLSQLGSLWSARNRTVAPEHLLSCGSCSRRWIGGQCVAIAMHNLLAWRRPPFPRSV